MHGIGVMKVRVERGETIVADAAAGVVVVVAAAISLLSSTATHFLHG